MTYQMTLDALANDARREIVEILRDSPKPVSALAHALPISRPAVSQHLKILSDAGLVSMKPNGTRHLYALRPDGIAALRAYLDTLWTDALGAYVARAHDIAQGERNG